MEEAGPLHVVAPQESRRDRVGRAVDPLPVTFHDSVEAFRAAARGRCDVVVDLAGGVDLETFHDLCREIADRSLEWTVLVPEKTGDGQLVFRPVCAGFPITPAELPEVLGETPDAVPPFDLHRVLRLVARVRHDINNPLTAGLAETQLLLMDVGEEGEVGESLQTIQRQLHRIRRLVQRLARLRSPSRGSEPSS